MVTHTHTPQDQKLHLWHTVGQNSLPDWTLISLNSEPTYPQRMPFPLPSSLTCLGNNTSYVRMLLVDFSSAFMQSPPRSWWQTFNTDFQHWSPIGLHFQINLQIMLLYVPNNGIKTKELNDKIKRRQKTLPISNNFQTYRNCFFSFLFFFYFIYFYFGEMKGW